MTSLFIRHTAPLPLVVRWTAKRLLLFIILIAYDLFLSRWIGSDGTFNFWDKDSKQRLKPFTRLTQPIPCCCFNMDGKIFAYASSYDWSKVRTRNHKQPNVNPFTAWITNLLPVIRALSFTTHKLQRTLSSCTRWTTMRSRTVSLFSLPHSIGLTPVFFYYKGH